MESFTILRIYFDVCKNGETENQLMAHIEGCPFGHPQFVDKRGSE